MARPIWSGVLTFGLVTVPVGLYTATEDHTVHFRQVQRGTADRVRYRRVNERTGEEVASADIVKGYDLGGGDYVVVEPEELDRIAPGTSRVIDVRGFVDLADVEPVYFARTYYLAPRGEEYGEVYELLRQALAEADKAGVATFVMRNKEYLTAVRAQSEVLVLHTLHWADEVRDPRQELAPLPERTGAGERELSTARQLIDALSVDWRPEAFHDTYEERVRELVDAKRRGEEVVSEAGPPEATNVVDLMDALRRSVGRAQAPGGEGAQERRAGRTRGRKDGKDRRGKDRRGKDRRGKGTKGRKGANGGRDERRAAPKGAREPAPEEDLSALSRDELYRRAGEAGVPGRSRMNRAQLAEALAGAAGTGGRRAS
ncbi:Ku protein [Streptomyces sp. DSM 44917]|uniref:Non-homologous end joining protein Ku n=1 Tax=Streptomyces boetiae TaxID=3075541 RepID=A0ABU2LF20_9ACTN|nr:Ku protein [Streptomyces sp. DSM 44917]MDT0310164.1 Ku protein [Streptomyces sp. DSM 44917]